MEPACQQFRKEGQQADLLQHPTQTSTIATVRNTAHLLYYIAYILAQGSMLFGTPIAFTGRNFCSELLGSARLNWERHRSRNLDLT